MEYQAMVPPFETKPFKEMDKIEAQTYFDWYTSEIPNRIELLKSYFEYSGGGKKELLDFSPGSLKTLWGWFITEMRLGHKSKEEIKTQLEQYPKWLKSDVLKSKQKMTNKSEIIANDIAIYFAQVFMKNFKIAKWGFLTKPKGYRSVNEPILLLFTDKRPMEPKQLLSVLCFKLMDGENNPNALFELYKMRKEIEVD